MGSTISSYISKNMKVSRLSVNSPRVFEKYESLDLVFGERFPLYFKEKNYGQAVEEIQYLEILVPDEMPEDPTLKKIVYEKEKKTITCVIQPLYKKVVKISLKKYGNFIANCYLDATETFSLLNVSDFDLQKFKKDLLQFFTAEALI